MPQFLTLFPLLVFDAENLLTDIQNVNSSAAGGYPLGREKNKRFYLAEKYLAQYNSLQSD